MRLNVFLVCSCAVLFHNSFGGETKIRGGKLAKSGEFPFQVALDANHIVGRWFCSGTLISDRFILSAAHCAKDATSIEALLGSINRKIPDKGSETRQIPAKNFYFFDEDSSLHADVVLLKMDAPVTFTDTIQPAKIATSKLYPSPKEIFYVSGWGIEKIPGSLLDNLHYIEAYSFDKNVCNELYHGKLKDDVICVSFKENENFCKGDSGGPMVSAITKEIVGVIAFQHIQGCTAGIPGGTMQLGFYTKWISRVTGIEM